MSDTHIRVPTWALPLAIGALTIAASYGTVTANAAATASEVDRIEAAVRETAAQAEANGTATKLNEQAIQAITKNLAAMEETAKSSDQKLQQLINILIQQNQN
jgi:F0F1-type ATP synthase epsilon subunit